MFRRFFTYLARQHLALLALFIALGGVSYAAVKLPANSVGTSQLKNNAVLGSKVKDASLTGADINAATLGKVPAAANADHATSADSSTNSGHATSADSATNATNAGNATNADNATNATNAGHATSADKATNATNADNASKLNGLSSTDLEVKGNGAGASFLNVPGCGSAVLTSYTLTLTRPSRIFGAGYSELAPASGQIPSIQVQLLASGVVVARGGYEKMNSGATGNPTLSVSGMLMTGSTPSPYTAAPGTYTLRLYGSNSALCSADSSQYQSPELSHIVVSTQN
jgi:hypothetical protein